MIPPARKSFAYYSIIGCLTIIGIALLFGMLWQPSWKLGMISIPFLQGHLLFSLWAFVLAFLSLVLFAYFVSASIMKGYLSKHLVPGLLAGILFLVFSYRSPIGIAASVSSGTQFDRSGVHRLFSVLPWLIRGIVILPVLFLAYRWKGTATDAPDDPANNHP